MSKLKALGAVLFSVLAVCAIGAPVASAEPMFHSESEHTIGTGEQEEQIVFTVNAGTIKCEKVLGQGTLAAKTVAEATTTPTYSNCTAFGFSVAIDMNGCHNVITADLEVHLVCPAGKSMQITAPGCTITVGPQSATSVEYENVGTGSSREIVAKEQGEGIHYVQSGMFCAGGTGTFTNGKAVGSIRTKGEDTAGKQVGIWWTDE